MNTEIEEDQLGICSLTREEEEEEDMEPEEEEEDHTTGKESEEEIGLVEEVVNPTVNHYLLDKSKPVDLNIVYQVNSASHRAEISRITNMSVESLLLFNSSKQTLNTHIDFLRSIRISCAYAWRAPISRGATPLGLAELGVKLNLPGLMSQPGSRS